MRIATRLLLALGTVLVLVMAAYGLYAQRHREALLGQAHLRDTEMMARLIASVLSDAARDDRPEDVAPLLDRALEHPEVVALTLVNPSTGVVAGQLPTEQSCLSDAVDAARAGSLVQGTADCGGRVDWAVIPTQMQGASLLVARRAATLEREVAAARWQLVGVTLILTLLGGGVSVLILRRTLSRPLREMLQAVERFGNPRFDEPVDVPEHPGELGELAAAFNDLDRRLEEKKKWIVREVEERLELEGRLRRVERFATAGRIVGGLAHELGSPLNVIGFRAEAILGKDTVAEDSRRHAREIVDEVDRIAALVRSLSHVDRNGGLDWREMELGETVRGVHADLEDSAREAGVIIETELPNRPIPVRGDPALLRLAIRNLVANALQATQEGGAGGSIRLRVVDDGDPVQVLVEDDGPGVEPEAMPRIFEPFFTTKEVGQGTGLGLSTALGIAERHGGDLRIESHPGEGVRAILSIPWTPRSETEAQREREARPETVARPEARTRPQTRARPEREPRT